MMGYCEFCGMRILVLASTSFEIDEAVVNMAGMELLITGVGVPTTIYRLQKRLLQKNLDLVVQAGIAGSFSDSIKLGEVVLVRADTFADLGMEEKENFETIFERGFADKDQFPFSDGWLVNTHEILAKSPQQAVTAITVNKVSDSALQNNHYMKKFSPEIETMEGAASHYVCLLESVPFVQIRSVSNFVGERDKGNWKIEEAIINLNEALPHLMEAMIHPGKPSPRPRTNRE